jgi:DNA-binding transcriptional ArsR family regulator
MDARQVTDVKNEAVAALAQAFASPVRVRILSMLDQAEHSVETLAAKIDQSAANTSAQVKVLATVGLLQSRKSGRRVYYRIASEPARALLATLQTTVMGESPAMRELARTYYDLPPPLTRQRAAELREQVRNGERVLVDLRPHDEYEAGHPSGALSLPAGELRTRIASLPKRPVLVYCRGRWCPVAAESVERLRRAGRDATNLGASARELASLGLR